VTKASENEFPLVTFAESSPPGTPSSGLGVVYEKTDGKLYFKNDAGTETELTAGGGGGSALLGLTAYAPGSDTAIGTSSGSDADLDATNLSCVFTAPASGNVLVKLSALTNAQGSAGYWTVREATTNLGTAYVTAFSGAFRGAAEFYITGLSAGSHTYKWGYYGAGGMIVYGGPTFGKAIIEIWAAP
jgi:hypothetical protein